MLINLRNRSVDSGACVPITEASYPSPFRSGLEYGTPARGTWNIVHTGMLIPEAHQIFVCADACLRGVVLTAAEMNASDRFSTLSIRDNNLLESDMVDFIVDGVGDILSRLPKRPPAILVYTSCVHHFIGCDLKLVYQRLAETFPDIAFTDCYMNPIMRKSGLNPDQLMRRQLYSLLKPSTPKKKVINIIGNDIVTEHSCELYSIARRAGYQIKEIMDCTNWEEYQTMADSQYNVVYNPAAIPAGDMMKRKLGQEYLYLPVCFGYDEITAQLHKLEDLLGLAPADYSDKIADCEEVLARAHELIGDTPIALDYTLSFRPLGLARLLVDHGFHLKRIYLDGISGEEKEDFAYLQKHAPEIMLYATVHTDMRYMERHTDEEWLALGQKAAYFTGTDHFVNVVECGGMYGFDGLCHMVELMMDAYQTKKSARELIQIKGLGCGCCS